MIEEGPGLNIYRLIYLMKISLVIVFFFLEISACYGSAEANNDLILRFTEELDRKQDETGGRADIDTTFGSWINYRLTDPLTIEISYAGLEKDERRPRENHRGESFVDGLNYQLEVRSRLDLGKFLSFTINPKLIGWRDDSHNHDFAFKEAYGRLSLYNIELEVGRDSLWWGPGYHGALLVSNNAFPFDMIKLGTAESFHLPWVFDRLGYFNITSFLTRLEEDRDFPRTKLFGLRVELSPSPSLEFGLSRVIMFGGRGRPPLKPSDWLKIFIASDSAEHTGSPVNGNQIASADFSYIYLSRGSYGSFTGLKIYGEIGFEDSSGRRTPTGRGYLFGLLVDEPLWLKSTDLRIEWASTSNNARYATAWYTHGLYTSGYTYKGNIIGHHMGSDARDLFVRVTRYFADWLQIGLQYDLEIHGLSKPVHEKKKEAGLDINIYISRHIRYLIGYEYERIVNLDSDENSIRFNPIPGEDVTNHYVWTSISIFF